MGRDTLKTKPITKEDIMRYIMLKDIEDAIAACDRNLKFYLRSRKDLTLA